MTKNKTFQQYFDYYKNQGVKINKLDMAIFQTKNGLTYPGFIATQDIHANEELVRIPRQLLLTTRNAFFSDI